ncbi:hypothetical protein GCM10022223_69220 [Kineosporia mesophila]|uniref:Uncharacterized protein n=1 Tax=Kineosporia mesophila TaxID=566012 RepID=A0ABP7AUW1_9ACTN|nr:hypothetical protein [Kineosporia mesophila]MCD5352390.1 hypothetical protein [Kineosporia mesophila]
MREIFHGDGLWTRSSVVDEEAVDHEREIGMVRATGDTILVRVAQRVDYDLLADPVVRQVGAPRITVGNLFDVNAEQARELAEYLLLASGFVIRLGRLSLGPRLVARA